MTKAVSGSRTCIPKTGRRRKGTPNKATLTIAEKLQALGCDSIEGMARIAMDEKHSPKLKGRYYSELAHDVSVSKAKTQRTPLPRNRKPVTANIPKEQK